MKMFISFSGYPLNDELFEMIIRRYSDENGNMDFDNYIGCLVRLDAMCRKFERPLAGFVCVTRMTDLEVNLKLKIK